MNKKESPFEHYEPVIPPIFSGRSKELLIIDEALYRDNESIYIFGNDALGKSSLVSTVYKFISENKNRQRFPVKIDAFDFVQAIQKDFLGMITHQVCAAIWTKIFKKNYSELIEDIMLNMGGENIKSTEEKTLKRIFKIVVSEKISGGIQEFNMERKPLASFEFTHLLSELTDIIRQHGFKSIIVFCDELNHFPKNTNTEILRNYFNVFSSKNIQFVIVAINPNESHKNDSDLVKEAFNYKLEIGHFTSFNEVNELIDNVKKVHNEIEFESSAAELLFESTNGHPWWIQKICDDAFISTIESNKYISNDALMVSKSKFNIEMEIYNERVKAGLPFRKFHL